MRHVIGWSLLALALLATGCSTNRDPTAGWSKERLYEQANREMSAGNFEKAIEHFETLEARYPFGPLALQAQLDIAYSYYQFGEYDSAISALDRFIKLHPRHEGVAYAYYLRGVVRFNRGRTIVHNFVARDMAQMDPTRLRRAYEDFERVVEDHGDSRYADDARKRMVFLRNELAEHELETARFYYERSAYTAAINRVDYLLAHYDGAPVVPEALALQIRTYRRLGMDRMAADTRRVLAQNWPDHSFLAEDDAEGEDEDGRGLLGGLFGS